jgi:hypothetical protein
MRLKKYTHERKAHTFFFSRKSKKNVEDHVEGQTWQGMANTHTRRQTPHHRPPSTLTRSKTLKSSTSLLAKTSAPSCYLVLPKTQAFRSFQSAQVTRITRVSLWTFRQFLMALQCCQSLVCNVSATIVNFSHSEVIYHICVIFLF